MVISIIIMSIVISLLALVIVSFVLMLRYREDQNIRYRSELTVAYKTIAALRKELVKAKNDYCSRTMNEEKNGISFIDDESFTENGKSVISSDEEVQKTVQELGFEMREDEKTENKDFQVPADFASSPTKVDTIFNSLLEEAENECEIQFPSKMKIRNMHICLNGTFTRDREEIVSKIEMHGGIIEKNIRKSTTDYLVSTTDSGSKYEKALQYQKKIVSEEELYEALDYLEPINDRLKGTKWYVTGTDETIVENSRDQIERRNGTLLYRMDVSNMTHFLVLGELNENEQANCEYASEHGIRIVHCSEFSSMLIFLEDDARDKAGKDECHVMEDPKFPHDIEDELKKKINEITDGIQETTATIQELDTEESESGKDDILEDDDMIEDPVEIGLGAYFDDESDIHDEEDDPESDLKLLF